MLEQMRKQSQSAIILLLFGFIIFVFVFSFGAGSEGFRSGGCGRGNLAAVVDGEEITETDFQYHYDQQLRTALSQRQQGKTFRKEDKLQLRKQVLDSMIDRALLIQAAKKIGLHVTNDERNASIRKAFKGENEEFDFKRYKVYVTRYLNTSPPIFEEAWRQQMLAERMANIIQDTARVTSDELLQAYIARETKINLEFVKVAAGMYVKDSAPEEKDIAEFAENNGKRIEDFYKTQEARYHKPKKAQVAHVYFELRKDYDTEQATDKKEQAELTVDDLKKGGKFEDQAKEYSEDEATREKGGDLGMLNKEALSARWGTAFAEAAFKLEEGKFSDLVKSDKGYHVIKCLKIIKAEDHPLEEVKLDIAKELLTTDRAEAKAKAEADRLFAGIKAGKKFSDMIKAPVIDPKKPIKQFGPQVGSTGLIARMGGFIPQIGMDEELAQAAFALTTDNPLPDKVFKTASPFGPSAFVVFKLSERVDPDMEAFKENQDVLRNRVLAGQRNRQLAAWLKHKRAIADIEVNQALVADVTPPGLRGKR
jgi:peptidyl-prolyl cis-trans isomerase D